MLAPVLALCISSFANADNWVADFEAAAEVRYFNIEADDPQQENYSLSGVLEGEITADWLNGDLRLVVKPFVRLDDPDSERTHGDLREASLMYLSGNWELLAGISKTFWGALESAHLVDIINQTDLVENTDGEDKLGQPMIRVTRYLPFGAIEAYVMSGFRERTFPGEEGRLRAEIPVDTDNAEFESDAENGRIEFATRFSGSLGGADFGISYFNGTNRDPRLDLRPVFGAGGVPVGAELIPVYEEIQQTSVDGIWALGGWLIKAEGYYRENRLEEYVAAGAGAEYTFVGAFGNADLGFLAEYLYDGRDTEFTLLQRDLFGGGRLVLNDLAGSELLFGVIQDLDNSSQLALIEATRRLGENAQIGFEARWFRNFDENGPVGKIQNDDYTQLELRYFF